MKTLLPALLLAFICLATARAEEEAPKVIMAENISELESMVGTDVVVEGTIRNVGKAPGDSITFLNFGDRKSGFVAVVFQSAYGNFPDGLEKFAQQKVRVTGKLEKYRDRQIQIKIATPDQIEVVEEAAAP
jgi:DNA/RNA endonuclease YhcR with UshA esterase domain